LDAVTVEHEPTGAHSLALSVAESTHQFSEFGRLLDLEEHFVGVVGDFDVQMFSRSLVLLAWCARLLLVRHCANFSGVCLGGGGNRLVVEKLRERNLSCGRSGAERST